MPRVHDRGGWATNELINKREHPIMDWELRINAIRQVLGQKGLLTSDELRRGIESIEPSRYEALSYYERWTEAIESILIEKDILTREEIDRKLPDLEALSC